MLDELECDIFANVNFGHGWVEVRCTETGEHDIHQCKVVLTGEQPKQNHLFEEE